MSCGGHGDTTSIAGYYLARAYCPAGTTLVGGGYKFGWLNGSHITPFKASTDMGLGTNSPDESYPSNQTTWTVRAGGYPDFCFRAMALCAE